MTAKEFLQEYRCCESRIAALRRSVEDRRARVISLSQALSERVQSGSVSGGPQQLIDACLDGEKQASAKIRRCRRSQLQVKQVLGCVRRPEIQEILTKRYILGQCWSQIAEHMGYQERQIYRLHSKGLEYVEEILALMNKLSKSDI